MTLCASIIGCTARVVLNLDNQLLLMLLLLLKKAGSAKAWRERLTPYQSEYQSPTIPTHRMKEQKVKSVRDKKGASS